MSSKIPHLLEPYLALPPEASLILLTSVLGASSNWLVLRFLYGSLRNRDGSADVAPSEDTNVLLISFMRDLTFWRENARRLVSYPYFQSWKTIKANSKISGIGLGEV